MNTATACLSHYAAMRQGAPSLRRTPADTMNPSVTQDGLWLDVWMDRLADWADASNAVHRHRMGATDAYASLHRPQA